MAVTQASNWSVVVSQRGLAPTLPQRIGRVLWAPMLVMALMAFPLALGLAVVRAGLIAQGAAPAVVAALDQYVPAAMFLGFASVFAAISFAIARILGVLRVGGGSIQEAAGRSVQTLRTPASAYWFIGLMMMAMMLLLGSVAAHVMVAKQASMAVMAGDRAGLGMIQMLSIWLEGLRRFGAGTYLVSIAFGPATIFKVLGFQATRLRELAREPRRID
jgi:hypothetical protein